MLLAIPIFAITLALAVLFWYQTFSHVARHINRIPGPGIPLLGVLLDFALSDRQKIFQNERDRCAKYPKLFKFWMFHKPSVFLYNPEDIEVILSSTKYNKKSGLYVILHMWLGSGLLTSDGDKWRLRRKMLTGAFHFSILKEFVGVFNEATDNLIKNLQRRSHEDSIDVVPPITEFTLQSIAETSMGTSLDLTRETHKNYKKAIFDFAAIGIYRISRPWLFEENLFRLFPASVPARQSVKILHEFTRRIIREKKTTFSYSEKKRLAMLDLMIKAQEVDGDIDDEGIREEVDTFMFEGHDTTAVALCYILMLLANHKQIQNEIRQEIIDVIGDTDEAPTYAHLQQLSFTERCVKECLRLYPSVPLIGRDIDEDTEIPSGFVIPKGSSAHIPIFDLHRDPHIYPDPEKFDPDRFLPENAQKRHPFAYVPFSAGPRNCIGQRFAMLELKAALSGILRKFELEPVDKPEGLVFIVDLVLRSANPIRVRFLERRK